MIARLHTLSERYPRFGYRKIYHLLKGEQWRVNRETVRRIRKYEGLQVIKKEHKRRPIGASTTTPTRAAHPNHVWSYDFVHDETTDGRRLKCLTVLDEYTREGLANPIERVFGDVHDKGTRNHTRKRLRDLVQGVEQHMQENGP